MRLPNAAEAVVPDRKLGGYLLLHDHPQNKGKAAFHELVGFIADNAHALRSALLQHITTNEVVKTEAPKHAWG